jgi:hypothetical protein
VTVNAPLQGANDTRLGAASDSAWSASTGVATDLAPLPVHIEVVPGSLTVHVSVEETESTLEGSIRCWSYVSDGLAALGQKEIYLLVRQRPPESDEGFPRDLLGFYSLGGPLAFAISGRIAAGERNTIDPKTFTAPMPKEWAPATQDAGRPLLIPDDILSYVWPTEH